MCIFTVIQRDVLQTDGAERGLPLLWFLFNVQPLSLCGEGPLWAQRVDQRPCCCCWRQAGHNWACCLGRRLSWMLLLQRTKRTATRCGRGRRGRLVGQWVELRRGRARMRRGDHPWRRSTGGRGARGWPLTYRVVAHSSLELGGVLHHKGVTSWWRDLGGVWGAVIASKSVEVRRWGIEQILLALRRAYNGIAAWRRRCRWWWARGWRVNHSHCHWVWCWTRAVLKGHPFIALRGKARLAIKG